MNFQTKTIHESTAYPGVKFTVRVLNQIQRARREAGIADARQRFNEMLGEYQDVGEEGLSKEQRRAKLKLDAQIGMLHGQEIKPAVIRAAFVSIEGFEIDGTVPSVETLIESGPDDLLDEIWAACELSGGLSPDTKKNLPSPGTSSEAEPGNSITTTAKTANGSPTTQAVTA